MSESRKYLETIVKLYAMSWPPETVAASPAAYLLAHGRVWGPRRTPRDVKRGEAKQCYVNAFHLAMDNPGRFYYVEGIGTPVNLFPVEHAWCVDRQGRVIDCTPYWEGSSDYFGVKINMRTVHAIQGITSGYSALAHWQHWDEVRALLTRG
jgi:hypothetical protein